MPVFLTYRQLCPKLLGKHLGGVGSGSALSSPCSGSWMEGSCLLTKVNALSSSRSLASGHLAESAGPSSRPLFRVTRSLENAAEGDWPTTGAIVLACRRRGGPKPIWIGQGARPQQCREVLPTADERGADGVVRSQAGSPGTCTRA